MPHDDYQARIKTLDAQILRQREFIATLDQDRRNLPVLTAAIACCSVPAWFWLGWFAAVVVLVGAITTLLSGYYLVAGHKSEYGWKLDDLESELEFLRGKTE